MRISTLCAGTLVALLLMVIMTGCGQNGGPPRTVVVGTVTYCNEPIAQGQIRFVPTRGSTAPVSIADIRDGKYRADAKGGVPVATQKVEIYAFRPDPKFSEASGQRPPSVAATSDWPPKEQYLPGKYNSISELEIVVELTRGEVRKDFELAE